jgi:hypothetical protein
MDKSNLPKKKAAARTTIERVEATVLNEAVEIVDADITLNDLDEAVVAILDSPPQMRQGTTMFAAKTKVPLGPRELDNDNLHYYMINIVMRKTTITNSRALLSTYAHPSSK